MKINLKHWLWQLSKFSINLRLSESLYLTNLLVILNIKCKGKLRNDKRYSLPEHEYLEPWHWLLPSDSTKQTLRPENHAIPGCARSDPRIKVSRVCAIKRTIAFRSLTYELKLKNSTLILHICIHVSRNTVTFELLKLRTIWHAVTNYQIFHPNI